MPPRGDDGAVNELDRGDRRPLGDCAAAERLVMEESGLFMIPSLSYSSSSSSSSSSSISLLCSQS